MFYKTFIVKKLKIELFLCIVAIALLVPFYQTRAASIVVDSLGDTAATNGDCTLREAINNANDDSDTTGGDCTAGSGTDTITFDIALSGNTIVLASPLPNIESTMTITGLGSELLELNASAINSWTIFNITNQTGISISGMTVSGVETRAFYLSNTDSSTFDDLTISGVGNVNTTPLFYVSSDSDSNVISNSHFSGGDYLLTIATSDYNIVRDSEFTLGAYAHYGITVEYYSGFTEVLDNTITGLTGYGVNIWTGSHDTLVEGNSFTEMNRAGISLYGQDTRDSIIRGNTITGNDEGGIAFNGTGTEGLFIENTIIEDNIIINNNANAISISIGEQQQVDGVTIVGNVISGNDGDGLYVVGTNNITIQGNYFGLEQDGLTENPNTQLAINFQGAIENILIGGPDLEHRNYFVGTDLGDKIAISLTKEDVDLVTMDNVVVEGNYIGLNINGEIAGMFDIGISTFVVDFTNSVFRDNVIAGYDSYGITLSSSSGIVITGNKIGTNSDGEPVDGFAGIFGIAVVDTIDDEIDGVTDITIGGINEGDGNIIAGNSAIGIVLGTIGMGNVRDTAILGNSIFDNTGAGIVFLDFNDPVIIANDAGDGDDGINDLLNHPVIDEINSTNNTLTYNLDVPTGDYRIEFFINPTEGLSPTGYGEGEIFIGSINVTSSGTELSDQVLDLTQFDLQVEAGDVITATATQCTDETCTDFLMTSQFSNSLEAEDESVEPESILGCTNSRATNYDANATEDDGSCRYRSRVVGGFASSQYLANLGIVLENEPKPKSETVKISPASNGTCSANQILNQNLKTGARNGIYHAYTRAVVTQAKILQAHLNRLGFSSGREDGILGPISDGAIKRMQTFLGAYADGYVGPITRGLLNNSCGVGGLQKM